MKKQKTRIILPLASLLLSTAALASCGGGFTPNDPDFVPDMNLDVKGTTITFWTGFGKDVEEHGVDPLIEEFKRLTGVTVKHESKGGYPGLLSAVNLASSSRKYPNVCNGYGDHFATYVQSNIIMHMDNYIEADKERTGTPVIQHMDYNDYYENYRRENENIEFKEDGTGYVLGVPFNKSTEIGTYNKNMLQVAQHFDPTITSPEDGWSYADVETNGKKMVDVLVNNELFNKVIYTDLHTYKTQAEATEADPNNKPLLSMEGVFEDDFKVLSYNSTDNWFIGGTRQWGSKYTEIDKETREGYVAFDTPQTRTMLNDLRDLFNKGYLGIPATWQETQFCSTPFKAAKAFINISSSAGVDKSIPEGDAFKVGVCPLPYKDKEHAYVITQGTNLCLLDKGTPEERLASWLFVIFMTQQANADFCIGTGYYPTGASVTNSETWQEFINSTRTTAADKIKIDSAKMNSDVYDNPDTPYQKFVDPAFVGSAYIRETVGTILKSLFYSADSVEKILSNILLTLKDYVRK